MQVRPRPDSGVQNLVELFLARARRYRQRDALYHDCDGTYRAVSWRQWSDGVQRTTLGLHALGVRKGDCVGLLSENRPEWTYADLGILGLGGAVVPIYPTSSRQDIHYILENAAIEVLFVSTAEQLRRIQPLPESDSRLRWVIVLDAVDPMPAKTMPFSRLLEMGRLASLNNKGLWAQLVAAVMPSDVATVIYTSGTTGRPKGVMLSHQNMIANCVASAKVIPIREDDLALSFLPLSHIFERVAGYYFMVYQGARIAYARTMQTVPEDIVRLRPTVGAAVPRFYEKIYARIMERAAEAPPWMQRLFEWALGVGREFTAARMSRQPLGLGLALRYGIARALVFNKVRQALGGRIRFFISGGAPLNPALAEFFYAAGVLILEGYGLTETSPVITVNSPGSFRFGTVGRPLDVAEVKISEQGEILTRGPCVMLGYFRNEEATREAIRDGWFHTGDVGSLDPDGYLKITDRIKDIIVTSGGKNISPQNIEGLVLQDKLFSQVVVIGDQRNYLVALIVPNREELERFTASRGLGDRNWEDLLKHPEVNAWVEARLRFRTQDLASYEQIQYFALLPRELTLESGELTPTLKVRRRVVMEKYRSVIESLYQKGEEKKRAGV